MFMVQLSETLGSLHPPSCSELLCSVKSAHIVQLMNDRCFIHGGKIARDTLKHIPGFMKRVRDGSQSFERNGD